MTITSPSPSPSASSAAPAAVRTISHWIDGAEHPSTSGRTAPVFNPATGAVTAQVALADQAEIDAAIGSARRGFEVWSGYSIAKRQSVLFAFRELLNARKDELAEIITAEHGKVVSDAMGEIMRGQEVVELGTGFPHLIKGAYTENASTGIDVYSIKQPLGVVGIISPFNFPAMVPMWFFPIAIAAGNAVVLKPSEKDPSAALWLARLWTEAGLPDGVFTVLQGDKLAVDGLLQSPDVASISFVGSTPIAQYIYETASRHGKRVQALGGAKNHMLVLPDADLDLVADQAVNAGYGAAGERCMAISVVLAVEPVADDLIAKITERIGRSAGGKRRRGRRRRAAHGPAHHRRTPRQGRRLRRHRRAGRRRRSSSTAAATSSTGTRTGSSSAPPSSTTCPSPPARTRKRSSDPSSPSSAWPPTTRAST